MWHITTQKYGANALGLRVSVVEGQKGKLWSSSALRIKRRGESDGFASSMWWMLLQRALGLCANYVGVTGVNPIPHFELFK